MKFRSRKGCQRIALTDGRIALISEEWAELPDDMAPAAYALGCISEDMANIAGPEKESGITVDVVKDAIKAMLIRQQEGDFTKAGLPDKTALNKLCGGKVESVVFDQAWAELHDETKE
jgi:hypothetical protein